MTRLHANTLLLIASAFWGFGNVAQKTILEHLDPLSAVGLRCLIGGLLLVPMMLAERHPNTHHYVVVHFASPRLSHSACSSSRRPISTHPSPMRVS